jgi:hypothetical protein
MNRSATTRKSTRGQVGLWPAGTLRDMGTHGSPRTSVPEVPTKWVRPARSTADLQVAPKTLFASPATLEDWGNLIHILEDS